MSAAKTKAQGIIDDNTIAVFSKSHCPYCRETKERLTAIGLDFHVVELDQVADGAEIQNALKEMTKQNTVPNIFIKQQHIGGNSDLMAKSTTEIKSLLEPASVL